MPAWDDKPSVPAIVYLYADRLVHKVSGLAEGTHVPCTDSRVQTHDLAVLLFATAYWSLRRQGVIDMEIVVNRKAPRVFPRTEIRVVLLERQDRPGLEGAIIANLEGEGTIRDTTLRWSRSRSINPWNDVIDVTIKEAITEGFIREAEVDGGILTRLWRGEKELEPICGRIATLKKRFDALAPSWREFRTRERSLHDQLYDQCRKSLMASADCWIP